MKTSIYSATPIILTLACKTAYAKDAVRFNDKYFTGWGTVEVK